MEVVADENGCFFRCYINIETLDLALLPKFVTLKSLTSNTEKLETRVTEILFLPIFVNFYDLAEFLVDISITKISIRDHHNAEQIREMVPFLSRYSLSTTISNTKPSKLLRLFNIGGIKLYNKLNKQQQDEWLEPFQPESLEVIGSWFAYEPYYKCVTKLQFYEEDDGVCTESEMELISKFTNLRTLSLYVLNQEMICSIPLSVRVLEIAKLSLGWEYITKMHKRGIRVIKTDFLAIEKENEATCCKLRIYAKGKIWFGKQNMELIEML
jgi:hypothetical protein